MLRHPETPKAGVELTTLHVTAIELFSTRLGRLCYYCYEFNIICGESPRHTLNLKLDIIINTQLS